jgi:hypothetical protein
MRRRATNSGRPNRRKTLLLQDDRKHIKQRMRRLAPGVGHYISKWQRNRSDSVLLRTNRQYLTKTPKYVQRSSGSASLSQNGLSIIVFDLHLSSCCSTPLFHVPAPAMFLGPSQCSLHAALHTFAAPAIASSSRILYDTFVL